MTHDLFDELNGMDTPMIANELVKRFNLNSEADEITVLKRRISQENLEHGVNLFCGVRETIDEIKAQGIMVGLATASPRKHVELDLAGKGLEFDYIVTIDDVMHPKPEPDIFMKCAEMLGVPYSECVVVEDAINGVEAAKKAGMKVVAITNTTVREKFQADAVIDDIRELPAIIETVFQK